MKRNFRYPTTGFTYDSSTFGRMNSFRNLRFHDIDAGMKHAAASEWFDSVSANPEFEYGGVEWQAYEFAVRLLVPPEPLREAFQAAIQSAQAAGYSDWLAANEAALDYIATRIAPKFGVSSEVIAKRLRVEKLWPPV